MSEQTLSFNEQGLLVPDAAISTDLDTVERYFVADFPKSKTRARLFSNLANYINQLQKEVFPWFEIWVDGSFVTMKENPKDVDVVVLLDYRIFDLKKQRLEKFYSFSLEKEGIDAYIVPAFPEGHAHFLVSEAQKALWHKRFSENRQEGNKGYLKLEFGKIVE